MFGKKKEKQSSEKANKEKDKSAWDRIKESCKSFGLIKTSLAVCGVAFIADRVHDGMQHAGDNQSKDFGEWAQDTINGFTQSDTVTVANSSNRELPEIDESGSSNNEMQVGE